MLARVMRLWRVVSASPKLPLRSSHHLCAACCTSPTATLLLALRAITSHVGDTTCACAHSQFLRLPSLLSLLYLLYSTERTPRELRRNSDSTPCLQKVTFVKIGFLKRLTHVLKALPYIPRLYTLHFTPYTRKIALKCDFSCISENFIVPLHREPAPRGV